MEDKIDGLAKIVAISVPLLAVAKGMADEAAGMPFEESWGENVPASVIGATVVGGLATVELAGRDTGSLASGLAVGSVYSLSLGLGILPYIAGRQLYKGMSYMGVG